MRTLHVGMRVEDIERSLGFYEKLGYEVVGKVPGTDVGSLVMLALPGDEFVARSSSTTPLTGRSNRVASATSSSRSRTCM
jgi:lactoylglutathione lyase